MSNTNESEIQEAVKRATIAIIYERPDQLPRQPFDIIGSGFCIHPSGIVVTCEHVHRKFFDPARYPEIVENSVRGTISGIRPKVLFYGGVHSIHVQMAIVPVIGAVTKTNFDLCVYRVAPHAGFVAGYPTLPIAEYEGEIREMLPAATCGFPLGTYLQEQMGTVTSSFTKGAISQIAPAPGVAREHLRAFQLDMTAMPGNSGGPVFSLETGNVFGVLKGGILDCHGNLIHGLARAEPVYPALEQDLIDRLLQEGEAPVAAE
jgi:hypothetical protein